MRPSDLIEACTVYHGDCDHLQQQIHSSPTPLLRGKEVADVTSTELQIQVNLKLRKLTSNGAVKEDDVYLGTAESAGRDPAHLLLPACWKKKN